MKRKVELVPYSPVWKKFFEKESVALSKILRSNLVSNFHIGSTAIESIVSKPTLDVLCVVHTLDGIELFKDEFERAGFSWKGEHGLKDRLYLVRYAPDGINHMCHVHIMKKEDPRVLDHLDFVEYLNREEKVAKQYEEVKVALQRQFSESPEAYQNGKSEFISIILSNLR
ncbi:GrpB family protein [Halobacteriovorax sp. GB3]|uniref:GrpB family protein n=1 Tax=Halobacteriovorax sp. GB3 TaxID=2719615 RepID=UPI002361DFAF|nr:GrpB family protein [Halobacteriovorax sp. GB3]MDD0851715.1 GrpB family protein [Halobacteriovorax sp. GB3]